MPDRITLKAARINAGLNQKQAAEAIGVTVSTLRSWEKSKRFPKQPQIERICDVYNRSYDTIFFG